MKIKQLSDNLPEKLTAHGVRHLAPCDYCKGIGDSRMMVQCNPVLQVFIHTKCYLKRYGFDRLLDLPCAQQAKFRVCDLSIKQMRTLIDKMAVYRPAVGGWVR